ncbi:hypothetical protein JCM5353_003631 [Sporobolomyces roseus]
MPSDFSFDASSRATTAHTPVDLQQLEPSIPGETREQRIARLREAFPDPLKAHSPISRKEYAENQHPATGDRSHVGGDPSTLQVPGHRRVRSGGERSKNWYEPRETRGETLARFAAQQPDPFHAITGRYPEDPLDAEDRNVQAWRKGHPEELLSPSQPPSARPSALPSAHASPQHSRYPSRSTNTTSARPSTQHSRGPSQNDGEPPYQREHDMHYQQPESERDDRPRRAVQKKRDKFEQGKESGCFDCC